MKNVTVFILSLFTTLIGFNQMDSLKVLSYQLSKCHSGDGCKKELDYMIIDYDFIEDTLSLQITGIANCSGVHNVQITNVNREVFLNFDDGEEVEYSDTIGFSLDKNTQDSVFLIDQVSISSTSECDCFYDFNFKILGLESDQKYHFYINGNIVLEPKPKELIVKDSLEKDTVLQIIQGIEEIKNHEGGLQYVICKISPENLDTDYYYQVKVFEEGQHKTLYEFKVYPKNEYKKVYFYYDFLELSFEEWRKYREYPQWDEQVDEPLAWLDMMKIITADRNDAK